MSHSSLLLLTVGSRETISNKICKGKQVINVGNESQNQEEMLFKKVARTKQQATTKKIRTSSISNFWSVLPLHGSNGELRRRQSFPAASVNKRFWVVGYFYWKVFGCQCLMCFVTSLGRRRNFRTQGAMKQRDTTTPFHLFHLHT